AQEGGTGLAELTNRAQGKERPTRRQQNTPLARPAACSARFWECGKQQQASGGQAWRAEDKRSGRRTGPLAEQAEHASASRNVRKSVRKPEHGKKRKRSGDLS